MGRDEAALMIENLSHEPNKWRDVLLKITNFDACSFEDPDILSHLNEFLQRAFTEDTSTHSTDFPGLLIVLEALNHLTASPVLCTALVNRCHFRHVAPVLARVPSLTLTSDGKLFLARHVEKVLSIISRTSGCSRKSAMGTRAFLAYLAAEQITDLATYALNHIPHSLIESDPVAKSIVTMACSLLAELLWLTPRSTPSNIAHSLYSSLLAFPAPPLLRLSHSESECVRIPASQLLIGAFIPQGHDEGEGTPTPARITRLQHAALTTGAFLRHLALTISAIKHLMECGAGTGPLSTLDRLSQLVVFFCADGFAPSLTLLERALPHSLPPTLASPHDASDRRHRLLTVEEACPTISPDYTLTFLAAPTRSSTVIWTPDMLSHLSSRLAREVTDLDALQSHSAGSGEENVLWEYQAFDVRYPQLASELQVLGVFLVPLLEAARAQRALTPFLCGVYSMTLKGSILEAVVKDRRVFVQKLVDLLVVEQEESRQTHILTALQLAFDTWADAVEDVPPEGAILLTAMLQRLIHSDPPSPNLASLLPIVLQTMASHTHIFVSSGGLASLNHILLHHFSQHPAVLAQHRPFLSEQQQVDHRQAGESEGTIAQPQALVQRILDSVAYDTRISIKQTPAFCEVVPTLCCLAAVCPPSLIPTLLDCLVVVHSAHPHTVLLYPSSGIFPTLLWHMLVQARPSYPAIHIAHFLSTTLRIVCSVERAESGDFPDNPILAAVSQLLPVPVCRALLTKPPDAFAGLFFRDTRRADLIWTAEERTVLFSATSAYVVAVQESLPMGRPGPQVINPVVYESLAAEVMLEGVYLSLFTTQRGSTEPLIKNVDVFWEGLVAYLATLVCETILPLETIRDCLVSMQITLDSVSDTDRFAEVNPFIEQLLMHCMNLSETLLGSVQRLWGSKDDPHTRFAGDGQGVDKGEGVALEAMILLLVMVTPAESEYNRVLQLLETLDTSSLVQLCHYVIENSPLHCRNPIPVPTSLHPGCLQLLRSLCLSDTLRPALLQSHTQLLPTLLHPLTLPYEHHHFGHLHCPCWDSLQSILLSEHAQLLTALLQEESCLKQSTLEGVPLYTLATLLRHSRMFNSQARERGPSVTESGEGAGGEDLGELLYGLAVLLRGLAKYGSTDMRAFIASIITDQLFEFLVEDESLMKMRANPQTHLLQFLSGLFTPHVSPFLIWRAELREASSFFLKSEIAELRQDSRKMWHPNQSKFQHAERLTRDIPITPTLPKSRHRQTSPLSVTVFAIRFNECADPSLPYPVPFARAVHVALLTHLAPALQDLPQELFGPVKARFPGAGPVAHPPVPPPGFTEWEVVTVLIQSLAIIVQQKDIWPDELELVPGHPEQRWFTAFIDLYKCALHLLIDTPPQSELPPFAETALFHQLPILITKMTTSRFSCLIMIRHLPLLHLALARSLDTTNRGDIPSAESTRNALQLIKGLASTFTACVELIVESGLVLIIIWLFGFHSSTDVRVAAWELLSSMLTMNQKPLSRILQTLLTRTFSNQLFACTDESQALQMFDASMVSGIVLWDSNARGMLSRFIVDENGKILELLEANHIETSLLEYRLTLSSISSLLGSSLAVTGESHSMRADLWVTWSYADLGRRQERFAENSDSSLYFRGIRVDSFIQQPYFPVDAQLVVSTAVSRLREFTANCIRKIAKAPIRPHSLDLGISRIEVHHLQTLLAVIHLTTSHRPRLLQKPVFAKEIDGFFDATLLAVHPRLRAFPEDTAESHGSAADDPNTPIELLTALVTQNSQWQVLINESHINVIVALLALPLPAAQPPLANLFATCCQTQPLCVVWALRAGVVPVLLSHLLSSPSIGQEPDSAVRLAEPQKMLLRLIKLMLDDEESAEVWRHIAPLCLSQLPQGQRTTLTKLAEMLGVGKYAGDPLCDRLRDEAASLSFRLCLRRLTKPRKNLGLLWGPEQLVSAIDAQWGPVGDGPERPHAETGDHADADTPHVDFASD